MKAGIACVVLLGLILGGCGELARDRISGGSIRQIGNEQNYGNPVWSPDGKRIVFYHLTQWDHIEVVDDTGKLLEQFRTGNSMSSPGWSGDDIVFLDTPLGHKSTTFKLFGDGGVRDLITTGWMVTVSWTRDGSLGAALVPTHRGVTELHLFNRGTGTLRPLNLEAPDIEVRISPTGRYVAVAYQDGEVAWVLVVIDVNTGERRELWRVPLPTDDLSNMCWSPDESLLGVRYSSDGTKDGLYLVDPTGQAPRVRFSSIEMVEPDWSPDGSRIVYATVGVPGHNQLRILELPSDWRDRVHRLQAAASQEERIQTTP